MEALGNTCSLPESFGVFYWPLSCPGILAENKGIFVPSMHFIGLHDVGAREGLGCLLVQCPDSTLSVPGVLPRGHPLSSVGPWALQILGSPFIRGLFQLKCKHRWYEMLSEPAGGIELPVG